MANLLPVARPLPPKGRQFALTWSIPDQFGGMTSAILHRSRALVTLARRPVDVLTFDDRPDYPSVEAELRSSGELIDGMRLINLYDFFRGRELPASAAGSPDLRRHLFTPLSPGGSHVPALRDGHVLSRRRCAADGTVLQTDHYREDGSLLLSDRRDILVPGKEGGRSVVLCDRDGNPVRSWSRIWSFYRFWLDLVRNREPSIMIVDSKTVAAFMLTYRRKLATTMHVVHNSHLAPDGGPTGLLKESRRPVFERLQDFDSVVLLTPRQKQDVESLLGPAGNLCVIPNSRSLCRHSRPERPRPARRGIVVAALIGRKRVDHAVRATVRAGRLTECAISLDIYGDGRERERLESLIDGLGAAGSVRLHGHRSDARARLREASFIVLTGRTEGLPLVLVEAMAAGCIPVAYDIPYGPADVITHGHNGFLVEAGDEQALAGTVAALVTTAPERLTRMRREARRAAGRFSDAAVTRLWVREMRAAQRRHQAVFGRPAGRVRRLARQGRRALAWPVRRLRLRTARRRAQAAADA
ncbi:glycosyltransferase [Streptomyces sp. WMMB 322]|uniref:glycosyltransferase n=1 Tax=Streptomyces sp. WMMB 322 TaxID=1286821 RepID=UPI000823D2CC|nr:glycosyltransferase [Streptomyces sp. WMMB 322]SCK44725.1 poly(glycerol-phosphate) alpha-glucosyltransferase [Streptomyces sp. WMMB 322]